MKTAVLLLLILTVFGCDEPAKKEPKPLQPGETVYLKSGSPAMTVEKLNADGTVTCVWIRKQQSKVFVESQPDRVFREAFPAFALERPGYARPCSTSR